MTRTASAKVAGVAFLVYIAAGVTDMALRGQTTAGADMAARLAAVAAHPTQVGILILLGLVQAFAAMALAVSLYGVTRHRDNELAVLGMACRLVECVLVTASVADLLAVRWLAGPGVASAHEPGAARMLAAHLLHGEVAFTALFFAVGSLLFAWLLLRDRAIPALLAWTGLISSLILVVGLPLQLVGVLRGPMAQWMWLPMAAFEIPLGFWFIARGVRERLP